MRTLDLGISEKDSEFARYIYKLKDLLNRYGAASILTHHENKDKDAKGINKVSGSARIPAAVWGIAQMIAANPNNDLDQQRWLSIKPREGEPVKHCLEINHKELWASSGILKHKAEFGDESGEKKTQAEMVLELLRQHSPHGLESREINEVLALDHTLYSVLARLEDRQLITKRRSQSDGRRWVYAVPLAPEHVASHSQQAFEDLSTKVDSTALPPPPPSNLSSNAEQPSLTIEKTTNPEVKQKLSSYSAVSKQTEKNNQELNSLNQAPVMDTGVIKQRHPQEGRGGHTVSAEENSDYNSYCEKPDVIDNNSDIPSDHETDVSDPTNQIYDFNQLLADIDSRMKKIGMTPEIGKKYLQKVYGVCSRHQLCDPDLIDFWKYMLRMDDLSDIMRCISIGR